MLDGHEDLPVSPAQVQFGFAPGAVGRVLRRLGLEERFRLFFLPGAQIFRADEIANPLVIVRVPRQHPLQHRQSLAGTAELEPAQRDAVGGAQQGPVLKIAPPDEGLEPGGQDIHAQREAPCVRLQRSLEPALFVKRVSEMGMAVDEPGMAGDELFQRAAIAVGDGLRVRLFAAFGR